MRSACPLSGGMCSSAECFDDHGSGANCLQQNAIAALLGVFETAEELHGYLWANVPEIVKVTTYSELAGEGVKQRMIALKKALERAKACGADHCFDSPDHCFAAPQVDSARRTDE